MTGEIVKALSEWVLMQFEITLKALANFSPGLSSGNPGKKNAFRAGSNPEGVASKVG
jgi:hypothetical protein